MKGILARKLGMTRMICPETGVVTPVTILECPEATVLQVKTVEKDGYAAAVLAAFPKNKKVKNVGGQYKIIQELPLCEGDSLKKGDTVKLDSLEGLETVKITSTSKGKGFQGVIKRYNFSRGPETHGSHHHREPGSVGTCAKPARILKGRKMPGHMGNAQTTLRGVSVMKIDLAKNLIALKGAVPGARNALVFLRG